MIGRKLLMDADTWYIQDGLELHLDGIYNDSYINQTHVDNPSIWKDLSGKGNDFQMINTTTTQDAFVFNGSNAWGKNSFDLSDTNLRDLLKGVKNRTIEVVCKINNPEIAPVIFLGCGAGAGTSAIETTAAGMWYRHLSTGMKLTTGSHISACVTTNPTALNSYSATYDKGHYTAYSLYQNNIVCSRSSVSGGNMNNQAFITIGGRVPNSNYNTPSYCLNGEVCAIRVYNRQLTEQERAHNLALDMRRFGISANGAVIDEQEVIE